MCMYIPAKTIFNYLINIRFFKKITKSDFCYPFSEKGDVILRKPTNYVCIYRFI